MLCVAILTVIVDYVSDNIHFYFLVNTS